MKKRLLVACAFAASTLAACGGENGAADQSAGASKPSAVETTASSAKEIAQEVIGAARGSGSIRIGDDTFDLDRVVCVPGAGATAIASDTAGRDGYPTLTIKTFPETMGGPEGNTASATITRNGEREQWTFRNGNIASRDGVFTANGLLNGARMVEQPDGGLKSEPYGDEGVKPFMSKIECR